MIKSKDNENKKNLNSSCDDAGRVSSILADGENLINGIACQPFGPVEDYTLGNSLLTVDRTFTLRDQVERIQIGDMDYQYTYYADGTVKTISGISFPKPSTQIQRPLHAWPEAIYRMAERGADYITPAEIEVAAGLFRGIPMPK